MMTAIRLLIPRTCICRLGLQSRKWNQMRNISMTVMNGTSTNRVTDTEEDTGIQSRDILQIANHQESQIVVSQPGVMEQHFEQEVQDSAVEPRRDAQRTRWYRLNFTRFWRKALRGGKPRRN